MTLKKNMYRITVSTFISACVGLILITAISCKKQNIGTPGENEIFLLYKTFSPTSLAVKKGTTITFTNKDNANHSITSSTGLFDSGKIKNEDSFLHTFNDAGTYSFYCRYHSNQQEQGTIIVQ